MVQSAEERKLRKTAQQRKRYHSDSKFRTDKNATDRAWRKANAVQCRAQKAEYNAKPESKAMQRRRRKAFEERYLEKHGHHPDSDWNKTRNECRELLLSDFVSRFASNEEIFPDEHEAMNFHIRDGTMTRFRRVAGLKLTRERELDRKDRNVLALLSLVDACKKKDPKAVALFRSCGRSRHPTCLSPPSSEILAAG